MEKGEQLESMSTMLWPRNWRERQLSQILRPFKKKAIAWWQEGLIIIISTWFCLSVIELNHNEVSISENGPTKCWKSTFFVVMPLTNGLNVWNNGFFNYRWNGLSYRSLIEGSWKETLRFFENGDVSRNDFGNNCLAKPSRKT